jgi:hypothetical protein
MDHRWCDLTGLLGVGNYKFPSKCGRVKYLKLQKSFAPSLSMLLRTVSLVRLLLVLARLAAGRIYLFIFLSDLLAHLRGCWHASKCVRTHARSRSGLDDDVVLRVRNCELEALGPEQQADSEFSVNFVLLFSSLCSNVTHYSSCHIVSSNGCRVYRV